MFYVSKITPFLFMFALINLFISLFLKLTQNFQLFIITLVFGFIGLTLTGAIYQIVPNSQNRKLSRPKLSYIVLALILYAFLKFYIGNYESGAFYLFIAHTIFLIHIITNLRNTFPITVRFLVSSVIYLFLASLFLFIHFNWQAVPLQLAVHTLTVGSMLNAIYGVEIAWIPMLIMDTLNIRKAEQLFKAKQVTTVAVLLAFLSMNYKLLAVMSLLEFAVSVYFLYIMYELFKKRKMLSPIPNIVRVFLFALPFLLLGLIVGSFSASHPEVLPTALYLHTDFMVYGFTAFTIFGGILHLLPRIIWNWKTSGIKQPEFSISDLVDEKSLINFLELLAILYIFYVAVDVLFPPLHTISTVIYLGILALLIQNLSKTYRYLFR